MKKIVLVLAVLLFSQLVISQNKFRFGLKIAPSVNWMHPDNEKKFESAGTTLGFNWGLMGEYMMSDNFSFYTGLELNHEKGKINYITAANYYMKKDFELIQTSEENGLNIPEDTSAFSMRLSKRTYKSTYANIPIGIKMKTKEIGYMVYYGEFGLNLAFRTGTKITDEAKLDDLRATATDAPNYNDPSKVNYDKDMQPIRMQIRVGLGAEYKISEGTSIIGALHYNMGFTNVVKKNSRYLVNSDKKAVSQKINANGIQLTIGVLF